MKTSITGLTLLEAREGKRFLAYQDSTGVWTIGVGHTGRTSPPAVTKGMTITQAQCDAFLAADLAPVEKAINALAVKLTQNQFDALASFIFNIGETAFAKSACRAALLKGDFAAAAGDLLHFETPKALANRREAEKAQFLRPDTHTLSAAAPAAAKPAAAPVAAAPAPSVATKKASTMTGTAAPATKAAATSTASSNVISSLFGSMLTGIETKLKDTAAAIESGTVSAAGAASVATEAVGSAPNAIAAAEDIAKLVVEVETHDWADIPKTAADFLAKLAAILANFKITLPGLTTVQSILAKFAV